MALKREAGKTLNIAFVLSTLHIGGSQKKIVNIVNDLVGRGHPVHLIYLGGPETLLERINQKAVQVFAVKRTGYFDRKAMARYREYLEKNNIRRIVCVNEYPLIFHRLAYVKKQSSVTEYASINTSSVPGFFRSVRFKLYLWLLRTCDVLIFGCERERLEWQKRWGRWHDNTKTIVLYNGVDTDHYSVSACQGRIADLEEQAGLPEGEPVLGMVAQLRPEKGHKVLLRAVRLLFEKGLRVRTIIVGDGPMRDDIEKTIKRYRLDDRVVLLGQRSDVREALMMIDVFVLPSVAVEVFSNAALEAMSMGCCVILSDIGGAREMVEEGRNGYVVPSFDHKALADRLTWVIRNQAWRSMGAYARKLAEERFSKKQMMNRYEALLFAH